MALGRLGKKAAPLAGIVASAARHPSPCSFTSACEPAHYCTLPCLVLPSASRCSPGTHSSIRSQSSPPPHPGPRTRAWEPATRRTVGVLRLYLSSSAAATARSSALISLPIQPPKSAVNHPSHPPTRPPPPASRTLGSSAATVAAFQSHINQPVGSVASQADFFGPSLATFRPLSSLF